MIEDTTQEQDVQIVALPTPELTFRSFVIMVVLGCILSAANTYLGLYSGFPVSVSIPSAIISLSLLKAFALCFKKNQNPTLEVNWIQTGASAGSVVCGATLITIPALIELGYWKNVNYWETSGIVALGSILGVLFSIPLRKTLLEKEGLRFPEGTATAVVIQTLAEVKPEYEKLIPEVEPVAVVEQTDSTENNEQTSDIRPSSPPDEQVGTVDNSKSSPPLHIPTFYTSLLIIGGALVGALFKFLEIGLTLWNSSFGTAVFYGKSSAMFFVSFISSPALLAIGYIVEFNIGFVVFSGATTAFWIAVPLASQYYGIRNKDNDPVSAAVGIFQSKVRYLGVGAMTIGSVLSIIIMSRSLLNGLIAYISSLKVSVYDLLKREVKESERVAHEDIPVWIQLLASIIVLSLCFVLLSILMGNIWIGLLVSVFVAIAGFMFAASSGYMAGIVGSSNNPISGITLATVLTISLLLSLVFTEEQGGPAKVMFVAAIIATASALASDNMQDLKTGQILGAAPWKQQIAQLCGIVGPAFLVAPIIMLLAKAYGIGAPTPEHPTPLAAPQARLMADVSRGVFSGKLPWTFVYIGMGLSVLVSGFDFLLMLLKSPFRVPVLAFATGLYLPFDLSVPLLLGGFISWVAKKHIAFYFKNRKRSDADDTQSDSQKEAAWEQVGMLISAGLITGESLVGIAMAIPIVISGNTRVFAVSSDLNLWWLSLVLLVIIFALFYVLRIGYLIPLRK